MEITLTLDIEVRNISSFIEFVHFDFIIFGTLLYVRRFEHIIVVVTKLRTSSSKTL